MPNRLCELFFELLCWHGTNVRENEELTMENWQLTNASSTKSIGASRRVFEAQGRMCGGEAEMTKTTSKKSASPCSETRLTTLKQIRRFVAGELILSTLL
jgi:hypothetical protein